MPGSSLWLAPPPGHPLHDVLSALINSQVPALFQGQNPPQFSPHLTLTSEIPPAVYGDKPEEWLDSIPWPSSNDVTVVFEKVKTEDVFFRRCYIKVGFAGVSEVAGIARARGVYGEQDVGLKTEEWLEKWKSSFGPHVSLMYENMHLDEKKVNEVTQVAKAAGILFEGDEQGSESANTWDGWKGGTVWLVPSDRPINEWKPIATRVL